MTGLHPGHVLRQGPAIATLGRAGLSTLRRPAPDLGAVPGPEVVQTVAPRSPRLVADYLRWCGGAPGGWGEGVPAHMFPQWSFPALSRTLRAIPWPLTRVLNQGCRITVHRPLAAGEAIEVRCRLESVQVHDHKVRLEQSVICGTRSSPGALEIAVLAVVPTGTRSPGSRRPPPLVPPDAMEIGSRRFGPRAGLEFAVLTGDFNPVHWVPPYARAAGFGGTILHGFATLAVAWEILGRNRFAGDPTAITGVDVRFVRPVRLPRTARVFLHDHGRGVAVGEAPGSPAYLLGTLTTEPACRTTS